ncbi:hypothetical protein PVK06_027710 [Gossypium arboreum]|uniref:Uncharacterized protein n=1 Tax=Gossypium arboreum TaxID=29729 RepID=A0ABR0P1A1_GOSAR|nr:hypothetical protein PVK06_027710 [Gossypium arboreum]
MDLTEHLGSVECKIEELLEDVIVEKEGKEAMNAKIEKMTERQRATVNRIVKEHKAIIVSLERKQVEALENFKKETFESFNNFLHGLKALILKPHTSLCCWMSEIQKMAHTVIHCHQDKPKVPLVLTPSWLQSHQHKLTTFSSYQAYLHPPKVN